MSIEWLKETVEDVPKNKRMYRFICFILGRRKRKITYEELYILYSYVYSTKKSDNKEIKDSAMRKVIGIYEYNNKKIPDIE